MRRLALLLAGFIILTAVAPIMANDEAETAGRSIQEFLSPDGQFDMEAARQSGYQGPLDMKGFESAIDRATGKPTFRPTSTNQPSDDPDDIYWDNSASPLIPGTNGVIYSTTTYNGKLIVGGEFTLIGSVFANNIAAWDGTSWAPLGQGMDSCVQTLMVYNTRLIAGGKFITADGMSVNRIAAWNETSWSSLGEGIGGGATPCVRALTIYENLLIVGGSFTEASGIAGNNLAIWNDTSWLPLESAMEGGESFGGPCVNALTVFEGKLIVGGAFTTVEGITAEGVASWDQASWSPLGQGMLVANALAVHNARLMAGSVNGVIEWSGASWYSVGSLSSPVYALARYDNKLVAGGEFTELGWGCYGNNIAFWDDTAWLPLDSGLQYGGWSNVNTLAVYDGKLVAGGNFSLAGSVSAFNIAAWDGLLWSALGSGMGGDAFYGSTYVDVLSVYNDKLIVGGALKTVNGVTVNGIASWNGTRWSNLGSGVNGVIQALMEFNDTLYVGGVFDSAGGIPAVGTARWDGSLWSAIGQDTDFYVKAFSVYDGHVIAAGILKIAAWDDPAWVTLQEGIGGGNTGSYISTLATYHNCLLAGGDFSWLDDGDVRAIATAAWNGSYWLPAGCSPEPATPRPHATVNAMIVHNDTLIGGGTNFWLWGESGWQQANVWQRDDYQCRFIGIGNPLTINAMTIYNNMLVVGGAFDTISGVGAKNIAAWDGSSWIPLGSGVDGEVTSLVVYNDALMVGGAFTVAGGKISYNLARWTKDHYKCGDANGDKKITVGDAVRIISYVFREGLAPVPLNAGDANCNGAIGVGDAVYIIAYIFRGGPAPCCP